MVCCRCNKTGSCRNCVCARAGNKCDTCQPRRFGRCQNQSASQTLEEVHTASQPTSLSSLSRAPSKAELSIISQTSPPSKPNRATIEPNATSTLDPQPSADPTDYCEPLPEFCPAAAPTFTWGSLSGIVFCELVNKAYSEVVHWKPNLFQIPLGRVGSLFVSELAKLFGAFGNATALESIAMTTATIFPLLLLQKPPTKINSKLRISCLERRMNLWSNGDLDQLLAEGQSIQARLKGTRLKEEPFSLAKSFSSHVRKGNINAALRCLTDKGKGAPLQLHNLLDNGSGCMRSVRELLAEKHPAGLPANPNLICSSIEAPIIHPVIFESLDAKLIKSATLRTQGAAGPSGIDASGWRRMCTCFGKSSDDLCHALAATAKRLCTNLVDPKSIAAFTASRLIALDKNPGVRPIGIGETSRRIIAKSILFILRDDVQETAGSAQLCAGQIAGVEAGAHAMRSLFEDVKTEGALLVDASNAFNSLNRQVALQNIQRLCPSLANVLINTYREPAMLFMDGDVLLSKEGTTQGDPLAMPMYALATIPLMSRLHSDVHQTWYADDASGIGKMLELRKWWDDISSLGPGYGYYANAKKTWLITKPKFLEAAKAAFEGTLVNITSEGRPYLGVPLGSHEYQNSFIQKKVAIWCDELNHLAEIAHTQPQAAYAAYTHGVTSKWQFLSRIIPNIGQHLQPLEDTIHQILLPAITGQTVSDN